MISLLQDQIEFLQEQLKSKDKIINSLIENISRNDDVFFSQKTATLETLENQTNYKQLKNIKSIKSRENQNKKTPECFCSNEKEIQNGKQKEDIPKKINKNMVIVRLLDSSCNPQKTIIADHHKKMTKQKEKRTKNLYLPYETVWQNTLMDKKRTKN